MDREQLVDTRGQRCGVDADASDDLDEVVGGAAEIVHRRSRTRGRRELLRDLRDDPEGGGNGEDGRRSTEPVTREEPSMGRLQDQQRERTVDRELPVQESDAEDRAAPDGTPSRQPEEQHVQRRLDVAAIGRQVKSGRNRRGEHEDECRGRGRRGTKPGLAFQRAEKDQRNREVDGEQRELERRNRHARDAEDRRREPRLHREHVALAVPEDGKRAKVAEVFRHQAGDGLIRIEIAVGPEDEHGGPPEHESDDERGDDPSLARSRVGGRHARLSYSHGSRAFFGHG